MEHTKEIEEINAHLEYATTEQISFVLGILKMPTYPNKHELMSLGSVTETNGIDTATPIDYIRRIEDIHPNVTDGNLVYDYRTKPFGELKNVNDWVVNRILNLQK